MHNTFLLNKKIIIKKHHLFMQKNNKNSNLNIKKIINLVNYKKITSKILN